VTPTLIATATRTASTTRTPKTRVKLTVATVMPTTTLTRTVRED
jgi:hypothetical protein